MRPADTTPAAASDRVRSLRPAIVKAVNRLANARADVAKARGELAIICSGSNELDRAVDLFVRWSEVAVTPGQAAEGNHAHG